MHNGFSTIQFKASPTNVDTQNRVLTGVILAQVGQAEGHGISVEQSFLSDLVALSKNGFLCNFGHNRNNMGFQFGRINNVQMNDGDKVTGDLIIYKNADASPIIPKMGTWLMSQAVEDPESVMLSLKFKPAYFYQKNKAGENIKLATGYFGEPVTDDDTSPVYVALEKVYSVDIVDDGALTDKMFSNAQGNNSLVQLFQRLFKTKPEKTNMENVTVEAAVKTSATPDSDPILDRFDLLEKRFKTQDDKIAQLQQQLEAKELRIAELESQDAAIPAVAELELSAGKKLNEFETFLRNRTKK